MEQVWIFNGNRNALPSAVFSSREQAEVWIAGQGLSGTLTAYPIDMGIYQWVIAQGHFAPYKPHHTAPDFIANFTSTHQEHYHYYKGLGGEEAAALAAEEAAAEPSDDALTSRYPAQHEDK